MSKRRRAWNTYYSGTSPRTIFGASLLAWYRADRGVTLNGSTVSQWNDLSGTGDANKNAVQGTPASQPTFNASTASYGGQPTITFGGSTSLPTGTWSSAIVQPVTIFVAGNTTLAAVNYYFVDSLTAGAQMAMFDGAGANVNVFSGTSSVSSLVGSQNTASICFGVFNGASSKIAVRHNTPQATGNAGANGAAGLTIGSVGAGGVAGQSLNGPMAELFVVSGVPSAALIASATGYMAKRYALVQGA